MSASPFHAQSFLLPEKSVKRAFDLGSLLGKKTKNKDVLIKILKNASAEEIVRLTEKLEGVGQTIRFLYF